ncbi:DEAH (Asp-Glu-Ala-His) box polypeptide 34 [Halocaridina rubra]|uniref:DEAH (Asp-Glu-Ala-His) box polypeptide 34 n=1 Tax=Halocaridina rubra TaxID=373956 RepID=A0AAN9AGF2_HALRR
MGRHKRKRTSSSSSERRKSDEQRREKRKRRKYKKCRDYACKSSESKEKNISSTSSRSFSSDSSSGSSDGEFTSEKSCLYSKRSKTQKMTVKDAHKNPVALDTSYSIFPKQLTSNRQESIFPNELLNSTGNCSEETKITVVSLDQKHLGPSLSDKTYCSVSTCSNSNTNSEDEIMFDWEPYRYELNMIFFREDDAIKKGTEEYSDFWKFLKKYQGLQKQKRIRDMCKTYTSQKEKDIANDTSMMHQLPLKYDKKYSICFSLNMKDVDELQRRLPPIDLEDTKKRLSYTKVAEFKFIILLYLDFVQRQKFEKYKKLRESQAGLPIAGYKEEIISAVRDNKVVVIAGDTGCGKSTQVPQYLLAAGYSNIACTQPRRIACISLSKRVAYETLNEFGSKVGYAIRFEKHKTEHTKIVFLTEGLLLRQVSTDSALSMYDIIILDEIHERHLQTDFLLGVMKCLIMQRETIKVVLMSATINIELFQRYFMGQAPVIHVPGRLYPIKLQYFPIPCVEQASKNEKINPAPYVRIMQLIDSKYPDNERGDMLIFLSGMSEITTVVEAAKLYAQQTSRWIILPLHSTLSVSEQEKVFDMPPEGIRKCIVSTNISETSVTIDGVRFVVDSGKVKEMSFDPQSKMQKLKEFWICQASAEQRKGRAGRTGPGTCFRLYSEEEYSAFNQYNTPEIQRVPLDTLVLQMISMGLPNVRLFPFIEPPAIESLENSLRSLRALAALTEREGLTTIGELLAKLPMDVTLGKMLIMGSLFHQVEPVLSLAAAMSVQSPFTNRARRDPECVALVKSMESEHGDPFTLLSSYRDWLHVKLDGKENSRKWCRKRGLEEQRFYEMTKLRHQFSQLLLDSGLKDVAWLPRKSLTSAERIKRNGELRQLHELKRELHKDGPRKTKVLKVSSEIEGAVSDEEENRTDIKDLDFRIKNDQKQLSNIYRDSYIRSFKDIIMLKIILCSGLYPNVAIGDEHNNYKPGSEQLFHTAAKPFLVLHPNSIFASHPEVLHLADSDIVELPGFSLRHPASTKHQILAYVSLLETNKAYLVDLLRVPSAQILLLFAQNLDCNADMSIIVCDNFIELKFPEAILAQNLVFQAVQLRKKLKKLLKIRIKSALPLVEDQEKLISEGNALEKDVSVGLIDFYLTEVLYSQRRLLEADIKVLHSGPGPGDCILSGNPFREDENEPCKPNDVKGGVNLTDFLTYNCLLDTECMVTTITSFDTVCPYCSAELHVTVLERLEHMTRCLENTSEPPSEDIDEKIYDDPTKKKYVCDVCDKTLCLSVKEILRHRKLHS